LFVGSNHDGLLIRETLRLLVASHQTRLRKDLQVDNKLKAPIIMELSNPALGFDHSLQAHAVDIPLLCSSPVSLFKD
jgi:hypothetical protein